MHPRSKINRMGGAAYEIICTKSSGENGQLLSYKPTRPTSLTLIVSGIVSPNPKMIFFGPSFGSEICMKLGLRTIPFMGIGQK